MHSRHEVTLQVSVTPADLPHARSILPHQLRQLGGQVSRVLVSVDLGATAGDDAAESQLRPWSDLVHGLHTHASVELVDYSDQARAEVATALFAGTEPPPTDFRGRPIHAYLQPLLSAATDWVLHLDSDMLLGGGSHTWVEEACVQMASDPHALLASPLPGPPRADGRLLRQPDATRADGSSTWRITNMSSRIFLANVPRFVEKLAPLQLLPAPFVGRLWTLRAPNPPYEKLELMVTRKMREAGLYRLDLLGRPPGLWSLHPPFRNAAFIGQLDEIVARVEAGDLPDEQRGDFDLHDSVFDWSEARRAVRRDRALTMLLGYRAARRLMTADRAPSELTR